MSETSINAVCVFCGARDGVRTDYVAAAEQLGEALGAAGVKVVFGGGGVGMMGAVSDAAQAAGGHVAGVIPQSLFEREGGQLDLPEMYVVDTMHERKALMHELSDAFVILPGGLGTYEEFFEILTWRQLGFHAKPIVVVDIAGFFQPLRQLIEHSVAEGFVSASDQDFVTFVETVDEALDLLGLGSAAGPDQP